VHRRTKPLLFPLFANGAGQSESSGFIISCTAG
jgi:hypothetical protein